MVYTSNHIYIVWLADQLILCTFNECVYYIKPMYMKKYIIIVQLIKAFSYSVKSWEKVEMKTWIVFTISKLIR